MRLFVGIPVPDSYVKLVASTSEAIAKRIASPVRWTQPKNCHLTLQFLGETEEDRVDAVSAALASVKFPAFQAEAGIHGCFPHCGHPRILWVGLVQGGEACAELATMVHDAMDPFGFKRGNRFTPHLTLGRVKKEACDDWAAILTGTETTWPVFTVDRFVLWQSDLRPDGPIYSVVGEFPLL